VLVVKMLSRGLPGAGPRPRAAQVVRLTMNHPLPDGNTRAAWVALRIFLEINGCAWGNRPRSRKRGCHDEHRFGHLGGIPLGFEIGLFSRIWAASNAYVSTRPDLLALLIEAPVSDLRRLGRAIVLKSVGGVVSVHPQRSVCALLAIDSVSQ